ncbi:hypothetical protein [Spirosoma validum]|uniref:Lipoprotein n=1 Tax=Spirosoma validum TaxID=2771355 RepID=A0A927AYP6_9BACT|nr:hypothetical protein [Spirosoma validum]MBD2752301.1 hypothetical protein [Spirosoma validum]
MLLNHFFTALLSLLLFTSCQKNEAESVKPDGQPTETPTDQYLNFAFDDTKAQINGDCVTGCINGEFDKDKFFIRATASNRRTLDITIKNFANRTGEFAFDVDLAALEFSTGPGSTVYSTGYVNCQSPYNQVNSDGAIHVTKWADKVDGYVEGSFKTTLYPKGECGRNGRAITCTFRVKRVR